MDMETLSEHAFVAKLSKHPILGSHALMEPYIKVKDAKKEGAEASVDKSAQDALIQIIEARLTNTKTVKEHMAKLWDELEHIVTGKKVDHQELKNKKRKAGDQEDGDEVSPILSALWIQAYRMKVFSFKVLVLTKRTFELF